MHTASRELDRMAEALREADARAYKARCELGRLAWPEPDDHSSTADRLRKNQQRYADELWRRIEAAESLRRDADAFYRTAMRSEVDARGSVREE